MVQSGMGILKVGERKWIFSCKDSCVVSSSCVLCGKTTFTFSCGPLSVNTNSLHHHSALRLLCLLNATALAAAQAGSVSWEPSKTTESPVLTYMPALDAFQVSCKDLLDSGQRPLRPSSASSTLLDPIMAFLFILHKLH
jgi:hypothetical protein